MTRRTEIAVYLSALWLLAAIFVFRQPWAAVALLTLLLIPTQRASARTEGNDRKETEQSAP